uniref:Uncharacterized protein n=1 Tax=Aegilops tauschii subsp. strangulata TaxID=200361 RepID=A0A453DFT0_AEGTS
TIRHRTSTTSWASRKSDITCNYGIGSSTLSTLSTEPDRLTWKWSASGTYSARSAYLATFHGSTFCDAWKLTWKCWAPPHVRIFPLA